jgi:ABC-type uncharacterized transport system substrate-binding protein
MHVNLGSGKMRRRDFIKVIAASAATWPLASRAQQPGEHAKRIGVLMTFGESDPEGQARIVAFRKGLQQLGWVEGRNIRIEYRWATTDRELMQRYASELVALQPYLIVAQNTSPDASCTGASMMPEASMGLHRAEIVSLAARWSLPAVYPYRHFVEVGGLSSYGADLLDQYRRAATYVDRILKGEKPSDLPVQAPTKFELLINLKTAKALAIEVRPSLLARADEVIE